MLQCKNYAKEWTRSKNDECQNKIKKAMQSCSATWTFSLNSSMATKLWCRHGHHDNRSMGGTGNDSVNPLAATHEKLPAQQEQNEAVSSYVTIHFA
jgi:hypothetical protein